MWYDFLKSNKFLFFVGGAATAVVGTKALKSKTAREICVKGLAKGMKLQQDAKVALQNMKEEAEDICYDAKKEVEEA